MNQRITASDAGNPVNAPRYSAADADGSYLLRVIKAWRTQQLAHKSRLFKAGDLEGCSQPECFLRRLNAVLAYRSDAVDAPYPKDAASAVRADGSLAPSVELLVLGAWVLMDGQPGVKARGGRQPNAHIIMKTVAAGLLLLRSHGPGRITTTQLARSWVKLFGEQLSATTFNSRIRSLKRLLPLYLERVRSGKIDCAGRSVRRSPEVESLLEGILRKAREDAGACHPEKRSVESHDLPVIPDRFEIELAYSSARRESEYRKRPSGALPMARLQYTVEQARFSSGDGARSDRVRSLVLRPDVRIRESYRVRALLDRIAILVSTTSNVSERSLLRMLRDRAGLNCFVQDRTSVSQKAPGWMKMLPKLPHTASTGFHFAIMIQEPDPRLLMRALKMIEDAQGLVGPVALQLVELAVDFVPKPHCSPEEQLVLREQMVGLLQRHHVAHRSVLQDREDPSPAADTRQFFLAEDGQRRTCFFVKRRRGSAHLSEESLDHPEVRSRILDAACEPCPFLNSTVYKGVRDGGAWISIQHKIADRTNPEKGSRHVLPEDERRARIELTVNGADRLSGCGLSLLSDLAKAPFRRMRKDLLVFRLCTCEPTRKNFWDVHDQLVSRGAWAAGLRKRAEEIEAWSRKPRVRRTVPKCLKRENIGLADWEEMNEAVGRSLDHLSKRWASVAGG